MKKRLIATLSTMLIMAMVLGCAGCGNKASEGTLTESGIPDGMDKFSAKLVNEFAKEAAEGKTPMEIAESLGDENFCGYACAVSEFEEGYLNGFGEEITGFKSCAGFMPWIGSVPFIGYIFELEAGEDAEEFAENLKSVADPRWNICTTAKEPVTYVYDNLVFLTMVPEEE